MATSKGKENINLCNSNTSEREITNLLKSAKKRRSLDPVDKNTNSEPKRRRDLLIDNVAVVAALKPDDLIISPRHRPKLEQLLLACKRFPESIEIINGSSVCFKNEFLIGGGCCGTAVYVCLGSDGVGRAIKVFPKHLYEKLLNERKILTSYKATQSSRIVNYSNSVISHGSCYLILDLLEQNLDEYIKEHGEQMTPSRVRDMILQMLHGLDVLHGNKPTIIHRDLKPRNILVDVEGNLALSDFGIGKMLPEGANTYHTVSVCGSIGWTAYESTEWKRWVSQSRKQPDSQEVHKTKWNQKSDIQQAGMIAFYIHTKGKHPFGEAIIERMANMHDDKPVGLTALKDDTDVMLKDLLCQMLARDEHKRPFIKLVLMHPYCLTPEERMGFLEAVGNEPEIKQRDPNCAVSAQLDNHDPSNPQYSLKLLPEDWKAVIDPQDLNTCCAGGRGSSSYDGNRYTDCLRFIRNVRQHWGDRPRPPLKAMGTASSLDEYFLQLFPALPLVVHQIVRTKPDWKARQNLKKFFPSV